MGKYAITVHGRGFLVPIEGGTGTSQGFIVTVFLEADDEEYACERAMKVVLEDDAFVSEIGPHYDPGAAEVFAEHWYELSSFDDCELPRSGFIFYGADSDSLEP